MSELEDGKACKDLWDFSVERGRIDTEKHPIGVLGEGLRSYIAALEAKLEAMERALDKISELSYGQGHAAIRMAADAIGKKLPDEGSLADLS